MTPKTTDTDEETFKAPSIITNSKNNQYSLFNASEFAPQPTPLLSRKVQFEDLKGFDDD